MSLFHRLTRTLRPTSFNAMSTFRAARTPHFTRMDPNFFGGGKRGGLGRRMYYTSYNRHEPMNMRLIWGVIGLNTGIFFYANYTKVQAQQGHPEPFINYLKNMTVSLIGVLKEHRYWTIITSTFSHIDFIHIAGNMLSFYYMGSLLAATPTFTPLKLVTVILGSGLTGSLGYLYLRMQQGNPQARALGFSGSVMGVGTVAAFLYPRVTFQIYGIIPVPLWALMAGYAFYDGFYANDPRSRVAHAGHLGGAAFGVVYYFAKLRGLRV